MVNEARTLGNVVGEIRIEKQYGSEQKFNKMKGLRRVAINIGATEQQQLREEFHAEELNKT